MQEATCWRLRSLVSLYLSPWHLSLTFVIQSYSSNNVNSSASTHLIGGCHALGNTFFPATYCQTQQAGFISSEKWRHAAKQAGHKFKLFQFLFDPKLATCSILDWVGRRKYFDLQSKQYTSGRDKLYCIVYVVYQGCTSCISLDLLWHFGFMEASITMVSSWISARLALTEISNALMPPKAWWYSIEASTT